MPVEVTERALRDALALAGECDPDGTPAAQVALEWMGWEGDGPLRLRRYDVQLFVWYTLPRKFLTSLEHKREAAAAVARTLARLGDRAATYAEVCRSPETDQLLHAWEADDPAAWKRFRGTPSCSASRTARTRSHRFTSCTGSCAACGSFGGPAGGSSSRLAGTASKNRRRCLRRSRRSCSQAGAFAPLAPNSRSR
jgi:hypothetical protein